MNSEQRNEQELADEAIKWMESGGHRSADTDAANAHELGQQLRQVANDFGTAPDEELRAMLNAHFENDAKSNVASSETADAKVSTKSRSRSRGWAIAASLLALGTLAALLLPSVQQVREAALSPEAMNADHVRNIKDRSGVALRDGSTSPSEKLPASFYSNDDVQFETKTAANETGDRISVRGIVGDGDGLLEKGYWAVAGQASGNTGQANGDTKTAMSSRIEALDLRSLVTETSPATPPPERLLASKESKDANHRFRFFNGQSENGLRVGLPSGGRGRRGQGGGQGYFEGKRDSPGASNRAGERDSGVQLGGTDTLFGRQMVKGFYREKLDRRFESRLGGDTGGSDAEQYEPIIENPFIAATGGDAISTFAIDVDTASYANMRRFINNGQLPPPNAVRLEELINYFSYEYQQPKGADPFSVNLELASCPWDKSHQLLRVGLQGKDVHVAERPSTNVVFLIDVSGSMNNQNKLPLLKRGFQMLVDQLNEDDRVSIVTYAGNAGVVLEPTSGDQKQVIKNAIEKLTPGGSTHGSAGIELAYQLAQKNFIPKGSNKVILATDGDLNVGVTNDDQLVNLIKEKAAEGVFLTVLGFGTGNLKDGKLEKLADNGNGVYSYIDSLREAHKVLVEQLSGALLTIAKDVKIQIEFNPAEVKSYRLLGYENRALKTEDFDNDRKDAGEIGAGHSVTALYEIVPAKSKKSQRSAAPVGMKYQKAESVVATDDAAAQTAMLSKAAKSGELATVAVRYKQPDAQVSQRLDFAIANQEKSFSAATDDFRFASGVAAFGMLLRGSEFSGDATLDLIEGIGAGAIGRDPSGYRAEFVDLVRKAAAMSDRR